MKNNNIAIGYKAGYYETGSNKLYMLLLCPILLLQGRNTVTSNIGNISIDNLGVVLAQSSSIIWAFYCFFG